MNDRMTRFGKIINPFTGWVWIYPIRMEGPFNQPKIFMVRQNF
jgi:hypothetical protein